MPRKPIGAMPGFDESKPAPDVKVCNDITLDPGAVLIEQAKAKLGEKARNMHFFLSDGAKPAGYYERQGYVPVWTALGEAKESWCDRGDPLLMRPQAKFDAQFVESSNDAKAQAESVLNATNDKYAVRDGEGAVHRPEDR